MPDDVGSIIEKFLIENKFDGLVHTEYECGCTIDDMAPCGNIFLSCNPAYKHVHPTDKTLFVMSLGKKEIIDWEEYQYLTKK